MDIDVTPEDVVPEPYCGPKNEQPGHTYNPWRDVLVGDFVLVRPSDLLFPVLDGKSTNHCCPPRKRYQLW